MTTKRCCVRIATSLLRIVKPLTRFTLSSMPGVLHGVQYILPKATVLSILEICALRLSIQSCAAHLSTGEVAFSFLPHSSHVTPAFEGGTHHRTCSPRNGRSDSLATALAPVVTTRPHCHSPPGVQHHTRTCTTAITQRTIHCSMLAARNRPIHTSPSCDTSF